MGAKTRPGLGADALPTLDPSTGDTLLESAPRHSAPLVGSATGADGEPARGDSIGRFVVLGVLGAGGMGHVYSAYDPHLDRKVAIKLLRTEALRNADEARVRMLREAQAMAKINHANVIKVHEVGMLGERVYVAMEFADAGTVRAWLEGRRTLREILAVFVQAGRGLAAAHGAGLVHRDFKPDNVLMSKDGSVRVTDFGLVGAVHAKDAARAPTADPTVEAPDMSLSGSTPLSQHLTRTGAVMGTPSYMAPEQFAGAATSERTDQFSFCVALYEAAYGARPFVGSTYQELASNVLLGALAPAPRGARVPGWMRRVLGRGLSVDPAARFPSMTALLAELTRDRVRRLRRSAAWSGAAACVAAGALAITLEPSAAAPCRGAGDRVAAIWNPARRARIQAAFAASGRPHATGSLQTLAQLVERWNKSWELGYVDACQDTRVRGEQSERLLDLRMQCLTRRLDETDATLELLAVGGGDAVDHALEAVLGLPSVDPCTDALALAAELEPPKDELTRLQVQAVRASLDQARAQNRLGRYPAARDQATAALAAARATRYRPIVAEALRVLGPVQLAQADAAGVDTLRESMHAAAASGDTAGMVDAAAWLVYGLTTRVARYDLALEVAELAEAAAVHARPPPEAAVRLANSRGLLDATRGKPAEAQTRFEQALALAEKALGPDHPAVLTTLNQLGNLAKAQGRFADARALLERVVAIRERVLGNEHPDVASALNNLGNVYRVEGKLDDARRLYERALAIRTVALGPEHPEVGTSYNNLGTFYAEQEDHGSAQAQFEKALALWEKAYGPDSVQLASVLSNLGSELAGQDKLPEARARHERAIGLLERAHGPEHPDVAGAVMNLGVVAQRQGKLDEAMSLFQRARRIVEKAYGPEHPDVADCLGNEATVLKQQRKYAEAQAAMEHAVEVARKAYGPAHPRVAMNLVNLGNVQRMRDDEAGALTSYQQSLPIFEASFARNHPFVSYSLLGIGDALAHLGRPAEAAPYLERALAIRMAAGMSPTLLAEARYALAQVVYAAPRGRARAVELARAALAAYDEHGDADNAREVRAWLRTHR